MSKQTHSDGPSMAEIEFNAALDKGLISTKKSDLLLHKKGVLYERWHSMHIKGVGPTTSGFGNTKSQAIADLKRQWIEAAE